MGAFTDLRRKSGGGGVGGGGGVLGGGGFGCLGGGGGGGGGGGLGGFWGGGGGVVGVRYVEGCFLLLGAWGFSLVGGGVSLSDLKQICLARKPTQQGYRSQGLSSKETSGAASENRLDPPERHIDGECRPDRGLREKGIIWEERPLISLM